MVLYIVLVELEIFVNIGNIFCICVVMGMYLYLVCLFGFWMDDVILKWVGLDYWYVVYIEYYDLFVEVQEKYLEGCFFYVIMKVKNNYSDFIFQDEDFLVFGKEIKGLFFELIVVNLEICMRMFMIGDVCLLNLFNLVVIIVYEVL